MKAMTTLLSLAVALNLVSCSSDSQKIDPGMFSPEKEVTIEKVGMLEGRVAVIRTVDPYEVLDFDFAADALLDLEADLGTKLSDDSVYKWAYSRAYDETELVILALPSAVANTEDSDYYYAGVNNEMSPFRTMSAEDEMRYKGCRGVYYVEGVRPEDPTRTMKGFAIKVNGQFYGLWFHCGWPGEILQELLTKQQIDEIESLK